MGVELSHRELSLLLFALEGGEAANRDNLDRTPSCEEACPVVESVEGLFGVPASAEKQLARHLGNHLREGWVESGMLEMMAAAGTTTDSALSAEDQARLRRVNDRLSRWSCEIKLDEADRRLLYKSISRLPRSAWLSMPRTLWRLRKKLAAGL